MDKQHRIPVTTRLERFFRKNDIAPSRAARACRMNRNRLVTYRDGSTSPRVDTVRRLVKGLNAMGYPCKANDLFPLDDDDENGNDSAPRGPGTTRFGKVLTQRGIKIRDLAARSGYPAEYTQQVANGLWVPNVDFVRANVEATRALTGDRSIRANDLFPIDDAD